MGAAAGVEAKAPADGSDLETLDSAREEVSRLRQTLGHLAAANGFAEAVVDCSDLCHGADEAADYARCRAEVVHIRACLRLSTQTQVRRARPRRHSLKDFVKKSFWDTGSSASSSDESTQPPSSPPTNDRTLDLPRHPASPKTKADHGR